MIYLIIISLLLSIAYGINKKLSTLKPQEFKDLVFEKENEKLQIRNYNFVSDQEQKEQEIVFLFEKIEKFNRENQNIKDRFVLAKKKSIERMLELKEIIKEDCFK